MIDIGKVRRKKKTTHTKRKMFRVKNKDKKNQNHSKRNCGVTAICECK